MADFADDAKIFGRISAAASPAAQDACDAMGRLFQISVRNELSRAKHAPHTRTPSPPGAAPALVSGRLRESVTKSDATPGPESECWVAPHTVYAVIQEYGGPMDAHTRRYMSWVTDGRRYWAKHVDLPERPYMRPVARRLSANGELTEVALGAFGAAIYEVEL
jgi:hypothetical protein